MNLLKIPLLIVVMVALASAPIGCGAKREKTPRRMNRLPDPPPAVPPQKNVAASAGSATSARTLSTSQRWFSCPSAVVGSPVRGSPR